MGRGEEGREVGGRGGREEGRKAGEREGEVEGGREGGKREEEKEGERKEECVLLCIRSFPYMTLTGHNYGDLTKYPMSVIAQCHNA